MARVQLLDLKLKNLAQINPVEPSKHRGHPFPSCDARKECYSQPMDGATVGFLGIAISSANIRWLLRFPRYSAIHFMGSVSP